MTDGGTLCKLDLVQIRDTTVQQWPYTDVYLARQLSDFKLLSLCIMELAEQAKAGNITHEQFLGMSQRLLLELKADIRINRWTETNGTES
jgi:hypothetical protein